MWTPAQAGSKPAADLTPATRRPPRSATVLAILASLCPVATMLHAAAPTRHDTVAPLIGHAADCVVKIYGTAAGREHGYGTGVLVSADGQIVTTLSLLVNLRGVKVVLADGRKFTASLERADERRQLALLRIERGGAEFPWLAPATSEHLSAGDTIIALGNWFKIADGNEPVSICKGILSLRTPLEARRLAQDFDYTGDVLIYDALTANPGAAGGPILDIDGRFVGLVGKVIESVSTNTRINYAIPGEEILAFLGGSESAAPQSPQSPPDPSRKPYIGVKLAKLGYRHVSAYVERVRPGSPAAEAGIRPDDLIIAIEGRRIANADEYETALARLIPGEAAQFTIKRGQDILNLVVNVTAAPAAKP